MFVCCQGSHQLADDTEMLILSPLQASDLARTPASSAAREAHAGGGFHSVRSVNSRFEQATGLLRLRSLSSVNNASETNNPNGTLSETMRANKFQKASPSLNSARTHHLAGTVVGMLPVDGQVQVGSPARKPWQKHNYDLVRPSSEDSSYLQEFVKQQSVENQTEPLEPTLTAGRDGVPAPETTSVEDVPSSLATEKVASTFVVEQQQQPPSDEAAPVETTVPRPAEDIGETNLEVIAESSLENDSSSKSGEEAASDGPLRSPPDIPIPSLGIQTVVSDKDSSTLDVPKAGAKTANAWRRYSGQNQDLAAGSLSVPKSKGQARRKSESSVRVKLPAFVPKKKSWAKSGAGNVAGLTTKDPNKMAALLKPDERKVSLVLGSDG